MTPEASAERHLQVIAEITVMRQLMLALCKQSPNPESLLADFEQKIEEIRHHVEVSSLHPDARFDSMGKLYARWIALAADIDRPDRG